MNHIRRKQNRTSVYTPRHAVTSRKITRQGVVSSPAILSFGSTPAASVPTAASVDTPAESAPMKPAIPPQPTVSASPAITPAAPIQMGAPPATEKPSLFESKEPSKEDAYDDADPGSDIPVFKKSKKKEKPKKERKKLFKGWKGWPKKKDKTHTETNQADPTNPNARQLNISSRTLSDGSISPRFLFQVFVKNIRTLFLWGVVCTLACMLFFSIQRSGTASVVMSLNYEESVSGKTPNGTRFSASEFLTQDYLQAVLERVGLQSLLTTQDLSDVISISPTNGKIVTDEDGYYITSSYNVTVTLPWAYRRWISAHHLLNKVCEVYQEKFAAEYRVTANALELVDDYTDMDFEEMGSYFSMMLQRIRNYLDVRTSQNNSYISSSGQSYSSIRKQLQNFETYTLAEFDSFIWNNGVAKDSARRINDLNELNRLLRWDEKSNREKSTALMDILEMYNNKMVSSVLVPTYDSSGAFYMSRTKVGIDDLALEANDLLTAAVEAQKSIATNQSKITALERITPFDDQHAAQTLAESLAQQLSDIVFSIQKLDADCYAQRISSYLVFTSYEQSFIQRYGVKMSLMIAVAACIFRYAIAVLYADSVAKKRQKHLYDDD